MILLFVVQIIIFGVNRPKSTPRESDSQHGGSISKNVRSKPNEQLENERDTVKDQTASIQQVYNSDNDKDNPSTADLMAAIDQLGKSLHVEMSDSKDSIINHITDVFQERFAEIEKSVEMAHGRLDDLEEQNRNLNSNLKSQNERILELENKCVEMELEALNTKRRSRLYNIRVYTIKEEPKENCREKLVDFIKSNGLMPGQSKEKISDSIEYVHRTGKKEKGKSRQMIARLYSREVKNLLVQAGKRKGENGSNLIAEDFVKEDYDRRKLALPHMRQAYQNGKKVKFNKGQLIIDGKVVDINSLAPP